MSIGCALDEIYAASCEVVGCKAACLPDGALSGFITGVQVTPDGVLVQFSYWFNGQLYREWCFPNELNITEKLG